MRSRALWVTTALVIAAGLSTEAFATRLVTRTGRVVCGACDAAVEGSASTSDCVERCTAGGLPIALQLDDGALLLLSGPHVAPTEWLKVLGARVQVTGDVKDAGGEIAVQFFSTLDESVDADGALAKELVLKDLDGEPVRLSAHRDAIVVLNFWAVWCRPCRREMPHLVAIQKAFGARGVQVIGATPDGRLARREIEELAADTGVNFPLWIEARPAHMRWFGFDDSLPATAILDRAGHIVWTHQGFVTEDELRAELERLLEPAPGVSGETAAGAAQQR